MYLEKYFTENEILRGVSQCRRIFGIYGVIGTIELLVKIAGEFSGRVEHSNFEPDSEGSEWSEILSILEDALDKLREVINYG